MNLKKIGVVALLTISLTACKNDLEVFRSNYSLEVTNPKEVWNATDEVKIALKDDASLEADSIVWMQNAVRIKGAGGNTLSRKLTNEPLGELQYEAVVYKDGRSTVAKTVITRYHDQQPEIYSYDVVRTLPHNPKSYTQGLEFYKGKLYESSGKNGESALRIVNLENGETEQIVEQAPHIFSEGLTVLNDKIYQLTWQNGIGYIYDLNLKKIDNFTYDRSKQGWGLANDGKTIYKSDGSARIWKLNAKTLQEEGYITVTTNTAIIPKINELEWVNGKIYANVYNVNDNSIIIIINPENGALEGIMDMSGLAQKEPNFTTNDAVLNGIAYDKENDKLYVTGKYWTQLFEIKIK